MDEGEEQLGNAQLEEHMKAKYNSVGEGKVALGGIAKARRTFIKLQETALPELGRWEMFRRKGLRKQMTDDRQKKLKKSLIVRR